LAGQDLADRQCSNSAPAMAMAIADPVIASLAIIPST
jgi:hypothetical protein